MQTIATFNSMSLREKSEFMESGKIISIQNSSKRRKLHGIGINDANYSTQIRYSGERLICPAYSAWADMIRRGHCNKFKSNNKSYVGVSVCEEWHRFSNFRKWWIENQVDGWQIDKDILSDKKEYSPDLCVFVPQWLNLFTSTKAAGRGLFPLGVHFNIYHNSYQAKCKHPFGMYEHLGYFKTQDVAHEAWLSRKLEIALELKPKMDEIDERIYHGVVRIIKNAR